MPVSDTATVHATQPACPIPTPHAAAHHPPAHLNPTPPQCPPPGPPASSAPAAPAARGQAGTGPQRVTQEPTLCACGSGCAPRGTWRKSSSIVDITCTCGRGRVGGGRRIAEEPGATPPARQRTSRPPAQPPALPLSPPCCETWQSWPGKTTSWRRRGLRRPGGASRAPPPSPPSPCPEHPPRKARPGAAGGLI